MQVVDRGFTYGEYASVALAEVKTPHFTRKKQLERMEVDWSQELSIVRIYVEHIMCVLKQKFTF